jgi:hypothetical protein
LTAITGHYIETQKDLTKEEHLVLINYITKERNGRDILQDIERFVIAQEGAPGGALLVVEYTQATRKLLSARLEYERAVYFPGQGNMVVCFDCGEPILPGQGDLHEGLISRGQVMKSAGKEKIFTRFNCAHRHNSCPDGEHSHTPGIGGDHTFEKFAIYVSEREGVENVLEWLEKAAEEWPIVGAQALQRFRSVMFVEETKSFHQGE